MVGETTPLWYVFVSRPVSHSLGLPRRGQHTASSAVPLPLLPPIGHLFTCEPCPSISLSACVRAGVCDRENK